MNISNSNYEEINKNIMKSGTSLVGIACKDGVILGADRRSTAGSIVMNKDSQKINKVNEYIAASYTGSVSDIQLTNKIIAAELRLQELRTKIRPSVKEAANLLAMIIFKNIRTPAMIPSIVGTLIAGFNMDGSAELFTIEPAGGVQQVKDYDANFSSGMPYILGLLERKWKKELTVQEAVDLAVDSIKASTQRDVASGNGIDVFSITKDGIKHVVSQEITSTYK